MNDHEPHHEQKPETDTIALNRRGITFTWRGLLAWALAAIGVAFSGGGFAHGMLYGSGTDLVPIIKEQADKQEANAKRISLLEADARMDRAMTDERYQRVREDLSDIKAALTHALQDRYTNQPEPFPQGRVK
jgi:hypothetical protein